MKRFFLLLLLPLFGRAQSASLLNAERAFSIMSTDSGYRTAFLHYLDSSSIIFANGEPRNGLAYYTTLKPAPIRLLWGPDLMGASGGGDLGFTTGPYAVYPQTGDSLLGAGAFATIWKRNDAGEWKAVLDLGTEYRRLAYPPQWTANRSVGLQPLPGADYRVPEEELITNYAAHGPRAFIPYVTPNTRFNLTDSLPMNGGAGRKAIPRDLGFRLLGGGVSLTGDLAYAFGTITIQGRRGNYLRVWGHTSAGWVLFLQVLS